MVLLGPASLRLDALARGSQTGDALTALKFSRIDRALVERAFVPLRLLRREKKIPGSETKRKPAGIWRCFVDSQ
jgi:hypothetical protein